MKALLDALNLLIQEEIAKADEIWGEEIPADKLAFIDGMASALAFLKKRQKLEEEKRSGLIQLFVSDNDRLSDLIRMGIRALQEGNKANQENFVYRGEDLLLEMRLRGKQRKGKGG